MKLFHFFILMWLGLGYAKADCWERAANIFNIEPELLYAIAQHESSLNPSAIGHNRNGSKDLGLMQINNTHLSRLKKLGVDKQRLLKEPCTSVIVGASILADMMKIYGYTWEAVGAYNAGTSPKMMKTRMAYAKKIWMRYKKIKNSKTPFSLKKEGNLQERRVIYLKPPAP